MKETIKLSTFLQTGKFGAINLGDTQAKVITELGDPDGEISLSKPLTGIHYGFYEFVFHNGKLRSIQNDQFDPQFPELMEFSNEYFEIDTEFLKADRMKTLGEISSVLQHHKIPYSLIAYFGRKALKTQSGVIIDFNDERWEEDKDFPTKFSSDQEYELIGIRYYPQDET